MGIIKDTLKGYVENNLSLYAAALSFYTIFALGPLFFIIVFVGSLWFEAIQDTLETLLFAIFETNAQEMMNFMESYSLASESVVATVIGIIALLFASIRLFSVLQTALGRIWEERGPAGVRKSAVSILLMLVSALVIIGVLFLQIISPFSNTIITNFVGVVSVFLLLVFVYKIMPETPLNWKDAGMTAFITTVFFIIGETVIGLVLSNVGVFSVSNAVIALLILIYYNWQVIMLGTQYSKEYIEKKESSLY